MEKEGSRASGSLPDASRLSKVLGVYSTTPKLYEVNILKTRYRNKKTIKENI